MDREIKTILKETVYSGFNKVVRYIFKLKAFDNKSEIICDREIFQKKDGVSILLYDSKKEKIILIKQFRAGYYIGSGKSYALEVIAGLVDKKEESLEETAIREVKEETGLIVKSLDKILNYFIDVNSSTMQMTLFFGNVDSTNVQKYAGLPEENENIEILLFSIDEIKNMLKNNEISSSNTLIAIQWFILNFK